MPNFIRAKFCGSFCRFINQSLHQYLACKPVGRRRWLHELCAPSGAIGPVGRREFEIKDADPFDKRIPTGHALNAHLLRELPPCYTRFDLSWDMAAAVEPGRLRRGGKDFDEGRGPGSRRPRPCP